MAKRITHIVAAIDNNGNIAPASIGAFDPEEHADKFSGTYSVVTIDGEIPLYNGDIYQDFILSEGPTPNLYEFTLKSIEDRWDLKITGADTIPADGSIETYTIQKIDADGVDITGTEDITISTSRGMLSTFDVTLVGGTGTFTLTSVAETIEANIIAVSGTRGTDKTVTFTPV